MPWRRRLSPRLAHATWVAALAAAYAGDLDRARDINAPAVATGPTRRAEQKYVAAEIANIEAALNLEIAST
jgi:hypothetical protein